MGVPAAPAAQKGKAQVAALTTTTAEVRRSAFSGNEVSLAGFYTVNTDCSSGSLVDVRVVKPPANGEVTFQEVRTQAEFQKDHVRARCNGKPVDAVKVLYRSHESFTGTDRMQIEVDYKNGRVRRYSVVIDVR